MNATARLAFTRSAMLLMEAMWAYALVAFLCALIVEGDRPSPIGVVAVVFVSFTISRLLLQSDLSIGVIRIWGIVMSLLVFYVIVRIDFFGDLRLWDFTWVDKLFLDTSVALESQAAKTAATGIPLLWFVWMRGVFRGSQPISFESVAGNFAIGVFVVAIVEAFVGVVEAPATVGHIAVPYIAVGLLAIATTQLGRAETDAERPFATTFFGVIGGAILVLGVLGLLFALADLGGLAHALGVAGEAVGVVLSRLVYYILYPFIWATIFFMEVMKAIWTSIYGDRPPVEIQRAETPTPVDQNAEPADVPEWFNWILRVFIGGPIVVAILGGLWFLFNKYARRPEDDVHKESTYQEGRLGADLGDILGNLVRRLRPGHGRDLDPARRLYFDMLHAAEDRDIERRPNETPLELAPRIEEAYAGTAPSRITTAFDDVRYGGLTRPREEIDRLRDEWDELRKR
jgi:hypothetical protein